MSDEISEANDDECLTYFFLPGLAAYHWGDGLYYGSNDDRFSIKTDLFLLDAMEKKGYTILQSGSAMEGLSIISFREARTDQHIVQLERDFDLMLINPYYIISEQPNAIIRCFQTENHGYVKLYDQCGCLFSSKVFIQESLRYCEDVWEKIPAINIESVEFNGPATTIKTFTHGCENLYDIVWSLKFVDWPSWVRRFDEGLEWPPYDVIKTFKTLGCHLVPVGGHRLSPYRDVHWRVSFSQAEIILSKSFSEIQRECFVVFKSFIIKSWKEFTALSSYALKNVFYWFMEVSNSNEWSYKHFGKHLLNLLLTLKNFLIKGHVPHFFLPENNLISHLSTLEITIMVEELTKFENSFVLTLHRILPQNNRMNHLIPLNGGTFETAKQLSESKDLYTRVALVNLLFTCLWIHVNDESNMKLKVYLDIVSMNSKILEKYLKASRTKCGELIWNKDLILSVLKALLLDLPGIMTKETVLYALKKVFRKHVSANYDKEAKSYDSCILNVGSFIEEAFTVEQDISNTLLLLMLIQFAGEGRIREILPLFSNFLQCFSQRPNQNISALSVISTLTKEGSQLMHSDEIAQALYRYVVALKLLIEYADDSGYVKDISLCVMKNSRSLLSKKLKKDKWIGLKGYEYCFNFLTESNSVDQQFVAELSCYYGSHLWNYTLCTRTSDTKIYNDRIDDVERLLKLSAEICISNESIHVLCYLRFLVFKEKFLDVIDILVKSKVKDIFHNEAEEITFDETDKYTVDDWLKDYIDRFSCITISTSVYRLYLLAISYHKLNHVRPWLNQYVNAKSCLKK